MSYSASYSSTPTTNTTQTTTNNYTYEPVAASGGLNALNTGSGNIDISTGITPTEINSLAGIASMFSSSGSNGMSNAASPTVVPIPSGGGTTVIPSSSGSGSSTMYIVVIGIAIITLLFFMRKGK